MAPTRNHSAYPGSNRGDLIAFVHLTPPADLWMATVQEKRQIYKNKVIGTGEVDKSNPRNDEDMEPVFYSFLPEAFYSSMLESFSISAVIDMTAGPGELAKSCVLKRIPYYGVVLSEEHGSNLRRRLTEWLQRRMATEGNTFYTAEWAKAYEKIGKTTGDQDDEDKKKGEQPKKPKKSPRKQPKKNKKDDEADEAPKKKKKISSSSSDSKS